MAAKRRKGFLFVAGCEELIVAIFVHLVNILKAPEFNPSSDAGNRQATVSCEASVPTRL